jgi:hypothetical protein
MVQKKMSDIMKELAISCLKNPNRIPSSEAAHVSLLLAQVAWNRSLKQKMSDYKKMLKVFLRLNPRLWKELKSNKPEKMIHRLQKIKVERYPEDTRLILVCGIRAGNVHVEWCEREDFSDAAFEEAIDRLEHNYGPGQILYGNYCSRGLNSCYADFH